jgi:secreted trypsin-like serine protease
LICRKNSKEKWKITGIVSFGVECGDPAQPGVYVNIPHYREWIDKKCRFDTSFHVYP